METWRDRVEDLLFDGETIAERVDVGEAIVVVTSHRVLAFTPNLEGKNFREAKRPNVTDAAVRTTAESRFLSMGLRIGLYGIVLLAVGLVVDFGAIIGAVDLTGEGTGQLGIGNVLGMVQGMISLIGNLDDYMRIIGAALLALAVVPVGVYLWSRERYLVLEVAGGPNIRVARPKDGSLALEQLREVIRPEGAPEAPEAEPAWRNWNPFD